MSSIWLRLSQSVAGGLRLGVREVQPLKMASLIFRGQNFVASFSNFLVEGLADSQMMFTSRCSLHKIEVSINVESVVESRRGTTALLLFSALLGQTGPYGVRSRWL